MRADAQWHRGARVRSRGGHRGRIRHSLCGVLLGVSTALAGSLPVETRPEVDRSRRIDSYPMRSYPDRIGLAHVPSEGRDCHSLPTDHSPRRHPSQRRSPKIQKSAQRPKKLNADRNFAIPDLARIKERMKKFDVDVKHWVDYDFVVINDDLETCFNELKNIITKILNNQLFKIDNKKIQNHVENLLS